MTSKTDKPIKPEVATPPPASSEASSYRLISLDLIDDPELAMRTNIDPVSVQELIVSLKQVGLIEPVVVKPVGSRYEVIAGHRRTYAARLAKIPEIPCHVRAATADETEMLKIHENLYRSDVRPADEALYYDALIKKHGLTPQRIANLISRSPSYVSDRLAILNYPDFLAEAMQAGEISFSVAREFAKFNDLHQMRSAVYYAKRGGMTQEMARKWVQESNRPPVESGVQESPNGEEGTMNVPVEQVASCVYCRAPVKLWEAQIVYMHGLCLNAANAQSVEQSPPDSN